MKYPYCIFDQINAALVSVRDFCQKCLKILLKPKLLNCIHKINVKIKQIFDLRGPGFKTCLSFKNRGFFMTLFGSVSGPHWKTEV